MTLRYILLGLDYDMYIKEDNELRFEFQYHTRFINNYFSREIRKYKIDTKGTFNMISIALLPDNQLKSTKITAISVLETYLPFDKECYWKVKGTEDCSYYLELLEQGLRRAFEFKQIPLDILLNLIEKFKEGNCRNEWIHKKKRFKEDDLEVVLICEFTTNYFQLIAKINQISTKIELTKGIVIKTMPDEIHFEKMFKDILIYEKFIVITDASDSARVLINIEDVRKGFFNKMFAPYIYSDDYTLEENLKFESTHNEIVKILSYNGKGF
ncbi:hypothetical protein [Myroides odoratimimus]|uniref:hypothetical protein n=1 Tax=Myroides odoratimimus TaxID=76832 RepID=UPI0031016345